MLGTKQEERPLTVQSRGVGVKFRRLGGGAPLFRPSGRAKDFWALRDVSLEIGEGELVGIVGRNGAGKSTLALLIAGIYQADEGSIEVNAQASRLALGVGFRLDLTGRQNIFINGAYLGFSRKQIKQEFEEIVAFAELQDFLDQPLKHYSTGMRSRLAFSIATCIKPEVLLMDESFATGDEGFRAKAYQRVQKMAEHAKTVVMISHDLKNLHKLCPRVLWLEGGRLMMDGQAEQVLTKYREFCLKPKAK